MLSKKFEKNCCCESTKYGSIVSWCAFPFLQKLKIMLSSRNTGIMPIFSNLEKSAILKIHHFERPSQFYEGHSDLRCYLDHSKAKN